MMLNPFTIDVEVTEEEILADLVYPADPETVEAPVALSQPALHG